VGKPVADYQTTLGLTAAGNDECDLGDNCNYETFPNHLHLVPVMSTMPAYQTQSFTGWMPFNSDKALKQM